MRKSPPLWIHFTDTPTPDEFSLSPEKGESISHECGGLFVYPYTPDFPVKERSKEWGGRTPIIIECEKELVELVQSDPIGGDRTRDEYVIPTTVFDKVKWWIWEEVEGEEITS